MCWDCLCVQFANIWPASPAFMLPTTMRGRGFRAAAHATRTAVGLDRMWRRDGAALPLPFPRRACILPDQRSEIGRHSTQLSRPRSWRLCWCNTLYLLRAFIRLLLAHGFIESTACHSSELLQMSLGPLVHQQDSTQNILLPRSTD
jgi:hypothetical protein